MSYYTPYRRDLDDITRRRSKKVGLDSIIFRSTLMTLMVISAFTVSPYMGFPMIATMVLMSSKK